MCTPHSCEYVCSVIKERIECKCEYVCSVIEERMECNRICVLGQKTGFGLTVNMYVQSVKKGLSVSVNICAQPKKIGLGETVKSQDKIGFKCEYHRRSDWLKL